MTDIVFTTLDAKHGKLGLITLNRANKLNALTHDMIKAMHRMLTTWASDNAIKAVIVRGDGEKAFCAGGDIRAIYDAGLAKDTTIHNFFADEYRLNYAIGHYPKPYVALCHGITMGGGVGVSLHGSHPVAALDLKFAMPETGIGFFPDVGGSHFLSRCPDSCGMYLALTGARITAGDAYQLGLFNYCIPKETFDECVTALCNAELNAHDQAHIIVSQTLSEFHINDSPAPLNDFRELIEGSFQKNNVGAIMTSLEKNPNEFTTKTFNTLLKKSPTSLCVTHEQILRGRELDLDACLQMEYRMVLKFLSGRDFYEGVKAVVIDKDHAPNWNPDSVDKVSKETVEDYFEPVTPELIFDT